jgi:tetratricopeptide (TPR) repeat protein
MAQKTNSFGRFWQELKRRKVFSVVTTYAATAYIIIEVTNNLAVPLHLPDWFASLELIILIIGLPVAVIVAWIFDFTPQGIKKTESLEELEGKEILVKPAGRKLRASYVLNAILIIAVIILAYPKIFRQDTLEKLRSSGERISVSVMPFQNMTNDTTWNIWQDGIQNELINSLSNSEELKVRQTESINGLIKGKGLTNYASITPSLASSFSQKLDAIVLIFGSIKQANALIRVNAQLIDSKTEEVYKSFQVEGLSNEENIFHIIDSLSVMVKNFLIISKLKKEVTLDYRHGISTNSPEAYRYFIYGQNAFMKRDYPSAVKLYSQAIAIDSNFVLATSMLPFAYANQGLYEQAKKWCLRVYENKEQMSMMQKAHTNWMYAYYFETPYEEIKYLKQELEVDNQMPVHYYELGRIYNNLYQYDKSIPVFKKALEIYKRWDSKPMWIFNYIILGYAYQETGQYKKERRVYKKAEQDFPDDPDLSSWQAILSLTEGDTIKANKYIDKYISSSKENSFSDAFIATELAYMYKEAGILDKSEEHYRQAFLIEPENPERLNNLSYFLIDKDRNFKEGLELIDKALELKPDDYILFHTKGWGLYKQGKFKEAVEILQKSWNLRRKLAVYDHDAYLHLEAAKKAVAGQK